MYSVLSLGSLDWGFMVLEKHHVVNFKIDRKCFKCPLMFKMEQQVLFDLKQFQ